MRAGEEERRVGEGERVLHARGYDRADRGGGDHRDRGGGVDSAAFAQDEGCGWCEGQECEGCCDKEDSRDEDDEAGEGLEMVIWCVCWNSVKGSELA